MPAARQSSRPRKASARAREAAADAAEEPPKTPVKRQKQTKVVTPPVAETTEDDAWAQCDACQKWRLLPKDHVVDEGKQWTCSLVGRSCDERADDAVEEPAGTVTPPLSVEPVSLKDLDTTPQQSHDDASPKNVASVPASDARARRPSRNCARPTVRDRRA